jgi:thermitase
MTFHTRLLSTLAIAVLVVGAGLLSAGGRPIRSLDAAPLLVGVEAGHDQSALADTIDREGARIVARIEDLNILVVEPPAGAGTRLARTLRRLPNVRYVEADQSLELASAVNDPLYLDGKQWNIDRIQAPQAWPLLPPGGKTIVAVIDSGVDAAHPDLATQVLPMGCSAELASGCPLGATGSAPRDNNGHGTHVAGIIGAATNNGVGMASVGGDRVSILAVRVAPNASPRIDGFRAIEAVIYAVNRGAKVINMSFGGPCGTPQSDPWRDAVNYAHDRDVLMVVAAGNDGGCEQGRYPATDPRVLSVAAVDQNGFSPRFTTRGPWVSVAAPGVDIMSTVLGGYGRRSGTSMAAPHVSGLAALLYQVPGATKAKVMEWIMSTCDGVVDGNQCGGVINAYRAVHLAVYGVDPGRAPEPGDPAPVTIGPAVP